ncbi:MAG: PhoPQ-activated pathogenicity-related family protein [Planctomycetaceae bacterium]|jgi:PhoPQ-activated pathogenicity-related protein|nr:PhoPQ-activated pathogenicity-related family protein [Planctomycetaceae bacterium]
MRHLFNKIILFFLSVGFILFAGMSIAEVPVSPETNSSPAANDIPSDLDAYLAITDHAFQWEIVEKTENHNEKSYLLEMTSQVWHEIPWKHYLLIVIPNKLDNSSHAALYITGKRIGSKPNENDKLLARTLAETCGMPLGTLFQVPNQPLLGNFSEDALIGETMLKTLETKDTTWSLLFPMVKSALRAMDAIQQVLKQEQQFDIKGFIVTGASKRGWTTWLAAASKDPRIIAIAPIVIDNLNIRKQMEYQIETWGDFSPSIKDYSDRNLIRKNDNDVSEIKERLWKMIDPYFYLDRLTLPKLLVHATNDPYWTVDAAKNYWNDIPGIKYMLTLPNAGHGLDNQLPKAIMTIAVFSRYAANGENWPKMDWKLNEQDSQYTVTVKTEIPNYRIKIWSAASDTKDFRQSKWTSKSLDNNNSNNNNLSDTIVVAKPTTGHLAFYVELESKHDGLPFSLTTQVWRF